MIFQYFPWEYPAKLEGPRVILLRQWPWDDFGHKTLFREVIYLAGGGALPVSLGAVKILQRGEQKTRLDPEFSALDERYCALGQSIKFYENLRKLGESVYTDILSSLMRLVHEALHRRDSYAVLATHSPIVLQEIPARSIRIIEREGAYPIVSMYPGESFGENLSEIVSRAFRADKHDRNYVDILEKVVSQMDPSEMEEVFKNGLSLGAEMLLRVLQRQRGSSDKP